ncbi:MAG: hypothetical protein ACAH59_10515 [Pseudobdellovibrionaceae bacterium]
MKIVELSVGGKTFVAGEYLALTGGPALMLATDPRFQMEVFKDGGNADNVFHPDSPAGKFWDKHKDFFSQFHLKFSDPYQVGGFGASSAQFALLHSFWQLKDKVFVEAERFYDWHLMLQDYRELGDQGSGFPPSGADVVGACAGGLTWFDRGNGKVQTFSWPFFEIDFFVVHTGSKLATHEHLKNLGQFPTAGFENAMKKVQTGLSQVHFETFLQGLQDYKAELKAQNRILLETDQKVQSLEAHSEILFAKGCGAMGSDVIFLLCKRENMAAVQQILQSANLKIMAETSKISRSLHVQNVRTGEAELTL